MTHLLAAFSFFGALILLMIRKDITKLLLAPLLLVSLAHAAPTDVAIECAGLPTGLTLTAKIVTAPNTVASVSMTEGTGDAAGYYYCTNAQVAAQSPPADKTFSGVLNDGTDDVATFTLYWYGTESRRVIVAGDAIEVSEEAAGEIIQPALDAIDALPTAAENATQLLATATSDAGAGTIGRLWHYALAGYSASGELAAGMFANQPAAEVELTEQDKQDIADEVASQVGSSAFSDVDQEPVGEDRTILLTPDDDEGLVGEKAKTLAVGSTPTFAVDFRENMAVNSWITIVDTPTIATGTSGGITFDQLGRDKSLAKFRATGVTAGTYRVRVDVTYYGGATATGFITLKVVE